VDGVDRVLGVAGRMCVGLLLLGGLLAGCHGGGDGKAPSVQFTKLPPVAEGGRDRVEPVAGKVTGAKPGQRIVLYAKSDVWWIQPTSTNPFTEIAADGSWTSKIHLGTEYAALLVEPEYKPVMISKLLPTAGSGVVAVATEKGDTSAPGAVVPVEKVLHFSGYDWKVRTAKSERGGKMHRYDAENATVDDSGHLHLKVTRAADGWVCSEVLLMRSLGYGTYSFSVQDSTRLEPSAVLNFFTWSEAGVEQNHREMDINLTQWGDPENKNAEYVVWPYYIASNVFRFKVPAGPTTSSLSWGPSSAAFETTRGSVRTAGSAKVAEQRFTSGIPSPGDEAVHFNFCAFEYGKAPMQHEAEVVIEKFQYLP
jgi:hypothetical protein